MSTEREPDEGGVDGPDHLEVAPSPAGTRRLLLVTAALLAAALVVVVALTRGDGGAAPAPGPTPSVPSPGPTTPRSPATEEGPTPEGSADGSPTEGADPDAPVQGRLATPLLPGADPGWELFAQDRRSVFRIRLDTGEYTQTATRVASAPGGGATLVAGPQGLLVQSAQSSAAVLVPDDRPARPVDLGLDGSVFSQVFPGPSGRVWVVDWDLDGTGGRFGARDLEGAPQGPVTEFSGVSSYGGGLLPDGSGGLLLPGVGGTWQLQGNERRRITRGAVLATGPSSQLLLDCDEAMVCSRFRRDVADGEVSRIGPAAAADAAWSARTLGQTSPDGRWAAVWAAPESPRVEVVDLTTGETVAELRYGGGLTPTDYPASMVWTPDGRHLLALDGAGVSVVEPATGAARELELGSAGTGFTRIALRG